MRIAIREPETGNLGIVDVSRPVSLTGGQDKFQPPPVGTVRSFGVITPLPNSFCGDFYEISLGAAVIPDFWNLEPIASIYTNALNVQDQDVTGAWAFLVCRTPVMWFGVDYYGEFLHHAKPVASISSISNPTTVPNWKSTTRRSSTMMNFTRLQSKTAKITLAVEPDAYEPRAIFPGVAHGSRAHPDHQASRGTNASVQPGRLCCARDCG